MSAADVPRASDVLADLLDRMNAAVKRLDEMTGEALSMTERTRLHAKAAGVSLARSYVLDVIRFLPPAGDSHGGFPPGGRDPSRGGTHGSDLPGRRARNHLADDDNDNEQRRNELMELSLSDLRELIATPAPAPEPAVLSGLVGQDVILRSRDSGVWAGELVSLIATPAGFVAELVARRIWSWKGAAELSDLATNGVVEAKMPATIGVTVLGACEILPLSAKARQSLDAQPVWSTS